MQKQSANSLLARQSISETCFQCHKQQRAEFRKRSHMPLPEGKMSCVDCHNPHGSSARAAAERRFRQRRLLHLPRREAGTVPLGARAGPRELRQLPPAARFQP